jgi:hypothetical protein
MNKPTLVLECLAGFGLVAAALAYSLRRWRSRRAVSAQDLERTWERYAGRAEQPAPTGKPMPEALLDRVMILRSLWRIDPASLAPWVTLPADYPRFQPVVYEVAARAPFRKLYEPGIFAMTVQQAAVCRTVTGPENCL